MTDLPPRVVTSASVPEQEIVAELRRIIEHDWRVPMSQVVAACERAVTTIEDLRERLATLEADER